MIETIRNAWKIPDLRRKLLFTVFIVLIYRLGSAIVVPFLTSESIYMIYHGAGLGGDNALLDYLNLLTGNSFKMASVFALSISPYITASIVVQLLTIAIPALERMVKEGGEEGRKKQNAITRYATVALALVEGYVYYLTLRSGGSSSSAFTEFGNSFLGGSIVVISFVAGSAVIMWLGEQIDKGGIGNGISIILFAGIVSRFPELVIAAFNMWVLESTKFYMLIIVAVIVVALVGFVVWVSQAERKLPVQYAKRVVGRKVYGGQSTHIPLKVNMTGVMPIIFASSIVTLPTIIASFFGGVPKTGFWFNFFKYFTQAENHIVGNAVYGVTYFAFIIAFAFFYAYAQFNPIEMANRLRADGGYIPGLRPGRPTSEFISRVMRNVTFIGAMFLGFVALLPILLAAVSSEMSNMALGGTTVLIVVGVALDTVRTLESQMIMQHYKGFLE